jgi:hypothetical protein
MSYMPIIAAASLLASIGLAASASPGNAANKSK